MKCIGKLWIRKISSMDDIIKKLGLNEAKIFETKDAVGTIDFEGSKFLILIHISWGNTDDVRKIKIWINGENTDLVSKSIMDILKEFSKD